MSKDTIVLLLVEDEALLHSILEEGLGDAGFVLTIKDSGTSAIAELDAGSGVFNAVVTDIRLGDGPSGWDVGRRARELVPDMPVIYMSGDSAADWASKGVPGSIMIQKPFVIHQVVTAIATLLNKDTV
jgi:DNA-binding NtrC family response regulator